jgi:hypothetical protein
MRRTVGRISITLLLLTFLVPVVSGTASAGSRCTERGRDSDHDHIPDCWERPNGLTVGRRDQRTDLDHDYLTALQEYRIDVRTTGDGIFSPYRADLAHSPRLGPLLDGYKDLDGDGFFNAAEYVWGTDPVNPSSRPTPPASGCWDAPRSVPANGSTSVTSDLQIMVDAVPNGSCLQLRADGDYRSNGQLTIQSKVDFTLDGNGATIFTRRPGRIAPGASQSTRKQVVMALGSNVTLENLTIKGPNPVAHFSYAHQAENGLAIGGTQGALIRNVTVKNVYGDIVSVGKRQGEDGTSTPARNVLVTDSRFEVGGGAGINLATNSDGVTFDGNTISHTGRSGIDMELIPGALVSNLLVENNTFSHTHLYWLGSRARGVARNITFRANQFVGETMQTKLGPSDNSGLRHENWVFDSNVSDTPMHGSTAIFTVRNTDGLTIVGNVQEFVAGASGRAVAQSNSCAISVGVNDFANVTTLVDPVPDC